MKNFLPALFLFFFVHAQAQLPFAETLPATDTNTLCPILHARICINDTFGVVFFEFGFDTTDLYDQSTAQHFSGHDTIFISISIATFCDSTYPHRVAAINQHGSMVGQILSFTAPTCGIGISELETENFVHIVPNPVTAVSLVMAKFGQTLELYDLLGRVKIIPLGNGIGHVDKNDFAPGIYLYRILFDGNSVNGKILIE